MHTHAQTGQHSRTTGAAADMLYRNIPWPNHAKFDGMLRTGTVKMLLCGQQDSSWSVYWWKTRTFWTRSAHHLRSSWKWARALGQPPHLTIRIDSALIRPYVPSERKWLILVFFIYLYGAGSFLWVLPRRGCLLNCTAAVKSLRQTGARQP